MKNIIIYEWHVFRIHFNMGSVPTELCHLSQIQLSLMLYLLLII